MKTIITLLFVLITTASIAQISNPQKQALLDLYHATQGEKWNTPWDLSQPVTTWKGVTVENGKVTEIFLLFNNLEGTLPESLNQLIHLKKLELSFNKLKGTLPTDLSSLTKLEFLALNGNNLHGTLPISLQQLTALKQLHLSSNNFSGSIPDGLGNLKNISVINLFDNQLTGTIPVEFKNLTHLKKLVVAENEILLTEQSKNLVFFKEDFARDTASIPPSNQSIIAIETPSEN